MKFTENGQETWNLSSDRKVLVLRIPVKFEKRGGRKRIVAPNGTKSWRPSQPNQDQTLIKALARSHRWKNMLENGQATSIKELADLEKINDSYLARILRLTLLAPDILDAILDGQQPKKLSLAALMEPFPMIWEQQREKWGFSPA